MIKGFAVVIMVLDFIIYLFFKILFACRVQNCRFIFLMEFSLNLEDGERTNNGDFAFNPLILNLLIVFFHRRLKADLNSLLLNYFTP